MNHYHHHRRAHRSRTVFLAASLLGTCGAAVGAGQAVASVRSHHRGHATITFLNVGATPSVLNYFNQTVIPRFEKLNPNISVQMSTVAWGSSFTKLETGIVSGTADDVFVMGNIMLPTLASKHGLYPLTKFVKNWPQVTRLNQAALQAGVWRNIQYGVPFNLDVRGLIYNAAMLKKAGIAKPPTTWAQYQADGAKLVQKSGSQVNVEGVDWAIDNSVGLAQTFNLLLNEAGGSLFHNLKNGGAVFTGNSAAGRKALDYLVSFYKSGISSTNFQDIGSAPPPIALGQAAMEINNAGSFSEAPPNVLANLHMTAPLRMTASSQPVGMEFVNKLGIYAKTKYPKQAWQFIKFLYTPWVLSKWDRLLGEAPPEPKLANTPGWKSGPLHQMILNEKYAHVFPVELQSTIIDEDLTSIVGDAIYQKISVPQALAQMKSELTPLLKP